MDKNIRDLIEECMSLRRVTNLELSLVKDDNGDLVADSHNIRNI
jgi:hypothetical protein